MGQISTLVAEDPATTGFVYGLGPAMVTLNAMAAEIARTDIPVLILGESGTGKDAYARLIHRLSQKGDSRLWKINCSSVDPGELLAQVHEAMGKLSNHEASGSIYLDNIQELDLACQRVLLSHLPDGESSGSRTRCAHASYPQPPEASNRKSRRAASGANSTFASTVPACAFLPCVIAEKISRF